MTLKNIILASASPRRSELLATLGVRFDIRPSDVDESIAPGEKPDAHALRLADEKARLVASSVRNGLVIGADTIVVLDDRIFGKPQGASGAKEMLKTLSNRTHVVMTGFAIIDSFTGAELKGIEKTFVTIKALTEEEIVAYVSTGEPLDKAGAYAIQGIGSFMVTRVEGSYTNVVGLPMEKISEALLAMGLIIQGT